MFTNLPNHKRLLHYIETLWDYSPTRPHGIIHQHVQDNPDQPDDTKIVTIDRKPFDVPQETNAAINKLRDIISSYSSSVNGHHQGVHKKFMSRVNKDIIKNLEPFLAETYIVSSHFETAQ